MFAEIHVPERLPEIQPEECQLNLLVPHHRFHSEIHLPHQNYLAYLLLCSLRAYNCPHFSLWTGLLLFQRAVFVQKLLCCTFHGFQELSRNCSLAAEVYWFGNISRRIPCRLLYLQKAKSRLHSRTKYSFYYWPDRQHFPHLHAQQQDQQKALQDTQQQPADPHL